MRERWRKTLPAWLSRPPASQADAGAKATHDAAAELRELTRRYLSVRQDSWLGDEVLTSVLPTYAARIAREVALHPPEEAAARLDAALRLPRSAPSQGKPVEVDEARLALSRWLASEGRLQAALALVGAEPERDAPKPIRKEAERLQHRISVVRRHAPAALTEKDVVTAAFGVALERACARPAPPPPRAIGPMAMLTSTLGAGGAERQVLNTALGLQKVIRSRESVAGHRLLGPLHVMCRTLEASKDDFFASLLRRSGVNVTALTHDAPLGRAYEDVVRLVDAFPTAAREGLRRSYPVLRETFPDVVHLWQDGMILRGAIPALLSGASRIVIGFRTVPPTRRPERMSPAYERTCRILLRCPRVRAVTNSQIVARLYAEWLDVDPALLNIVPNGVEPLAPEPDEESSRRWAEFEAATPDARFTLGAVMRLDENKRPLTWIETAAALAERRPDMRFVIVGDGPLRDAMEELALRRGIGGRTLFVGLSDRVGFWLARMDALMLLSREEGLPNSLIEAQLAGVPVVTTPAGGAAETLTPDKTGLLLDAADVVAPRAVAEMVARRLVDDSQSRAAMADQARAWARERFSIRAMIENTIRIYGYSF